MKLNVEHTLKRAQAYVRKGKNDQARELYESVLHAYPGNKRARQGLAALQPVSAAKTGDHKPPQDQVDAVAVLYNQGQLEQAAQEAARLSARYPSSVLIWNILGAVHKKLGHLDDAVHAFQKARDLNPNYAPVHNNLGVALQNKGKVDAAIESYQRALTIQPDYADALNNLGNALTDQGRLDDAVETYRRAITIKPTFPLLHFNLAYVLNAQGKLDDAVSAYQKAIEVQPDFADAHLNLGNILKKQDKLDAALTAYQRALEIRPDFASAAHNLGGILRSNGQVDTALRIYNDALEFNPENAELHKDIGNALKALSRPVEALTSYQRALDLAKIQGDQDTRLSAARSIAKLPTGMLDKQMRAKIDEVYKEIPSDNLKFSKNLFFKADLYRHAGLLSEFATTLHHGNKAKQQEFGDDFQHGIQLIRKGWATAIKRVSSLRFEYEAPVTPKLEPLFIIGPSRSGKSTLEYILAMSENFIPRYEAVKLSVLKEFQERGYKSSIPLSNEEIFQKAFYIEEKEIPAQPKSIVVCTNPSLAFHAALLEEIFKNMYVVYVERCFKELMIEIYANRYRSSNHYAYDLEEIENYINNYKTVMGILENKIGKRFLKLTRDEILRSPMESLERVSQLVGMKVDTEVSAGYSKSNSEYYDKMAKLLGIEDRGSP